MGVWVAHFWRNGKFGCCLGFFFWFFGRGGGGGVLDFINFLKQMEEGLIGIFLILYNRDQYSS